MHLFIFIYYHIHFLSLALFVYAHKQILVNVNICIVYIDLLTATLLKWRKDRELGSESVLDRADPNLDWTRLAETWNSGRFSPGWDQLTLSWTKSGRTLIGQFYLIQLGSASPSSRKTDPGCSSPVEPVHWPILENVCWFRLILDDSGWNGSRIDPSRSIQIQIGQFQSRSIQWTTLKLFRSNQDRPLQWIMLKSFRSCSNTPSSQIFCQTEQKNRKRFLKHWSLNA